MENEEHWIWRSLRWVRDEAAALGFGLVLILVLAGIELWLISSFLAVDATFIRPLAPPNIAPEVLQHISWALRAFGVVVGMALVYFHAQQMRKWFATFRWLAGFCAALLFCHAMGLAFKSMDDQYKSASTIEAVETVNVDSINEQIATLQASKAEVRSDTELTVSTYREAIDNITSDGLDNDEQADSYRADITEALKARDARIEALDAQITTLQADARETTSVASEEKVQADGVADLFTGLARLATFTFDPAEQPSLILSYAIGILFWIIWYGFGEALMLLIPPATFAIVLRHRDVAAERHASAKRSEATSKGNETKERTARKVLKIKTTAERHLPKWKHALRLANNTTWYTEHIGKRAFGSEGEMHNAINEMRKAGYVDSGVITEDEIRKVLRKDENLPVPSNHVDVIDPDPSLNGAASEDEGNVYDDTERDSAH